ncbi:MAG: hypothetical protein JKY52_09315 [Flavobacteriales bacterium]|nr:hypothetical protein [Flavobacteriales bacterium]
MTAIRTTDFLIEVAKGNVPGNSLFSCIARGAASTALRDVWGGSGDLIYPTTGETWEIVSDNAADTSAGTGARTVLITSLDASYVQQTETVTLNGTTAVTLVNTHFRPVGAQVIDSGSATWNVGELSIQASGGGNQRSVIGATQGRAFDGSFTVPAGKTVLFLQNFILMPKNLSGTVRARFRDSANSNAAWFSTGDLPVYQNMLTFPIMAKFPIAEKTDFRSISLLDSGVGEVTVISELLLVDN